MTAPTIFAMIASIFIFPSCFRQTAARRKRKEPDAAALSRSMIPGPDAPRRKTRGKERGPYSVLLPERFSAAGHRALHLRYSSLSFSRATSILSPHPDPGRLRVLLLRQAFAVSLRTSFAVMKLTPGRAGTHLPYYARQNLSTRDDRNISAAPSGRIFLGKLLREARALRKSAAPPPW